MANIPQSNNTVELVAAPVDPAIVTQLVFDIRIPPLRENSMLALAKIMDPNVAPLLWNTSGVVAALMQEIIAVYPLLSPPTLTRAQSNRVCSALALLQSLASHPDTRKLFLNAQIPSYLDPFLNITNTSVPFEQVKVTSLGIFGALVKGGETEVISFLLSSEIVPLCLRTMEMGRELTRTVATFILQKILLHEVGLAYVCEAERFYAVVSVLGNMVVALAAQPSPRLLKHIIRCYLALSYNPRACLALRSRLPEVLRDGTLDSCIREDLPTRRWFLMLLHNLRAMVPPTHAGG